MKKRAVVLPGDGIGPEIVDSAVAVLEKIAEKYGGALGTETRGNIFAATLTISACK